ncbi:MAG TPA: hypothetical protein VN224_00985 [Xanthomonadales bacterium]|nr:hypothetical protein [Xanthomonadales bacterium]
MDLFPRRDRRDRNVLAAALVLSLLVHLIAGGAWALYASRVATALAKLVPRPSPTPEYVATSDAITIEKRTVPRAMRRAAEQPPPGRPRPRRVAQALMPRPVPIAVPTLPPPSAGVPAAEPTAAPARPPRHGTIHHPLPGATAAPPRAVAVNPPAATSSTTTATTAHGAFSPQQIAALDAQFSKTITQAQRALTNVPPQTRRPATTMKRYQLVMAGSRGDLTSAQGQCRATQTWYRGPVVWHYMDCDFIYTDGFGEHVLIPWPQRFARNDDPSDHPYKMYPVEDPPPGWTLPHPFAFSRLVCIFYKTECQALVDRERANGDPNYAPP